VVSNHPHLWFRLATKPLNFEVDSSVKTVIVDK